jgi:hypothetical protein
MMFLLRAFGARFIHRQRRVALDTLLNRLGALAVPLIFSAAPREQVFFTRCRL